MTGCSMSDNISNPAVKKGCVVVRDWSEESRIREAARIRENALHDEASALKNAWKEGYEEGLALARAEGRNDIINKMRLAGLSDEQINRILSYND